MRNDSMVATEHRVARLESLLEAGDRLIAYAQEMIIPDVPNFQAWRNSVQRILKESKQDDR